jgi:hypothetical protein
MHYPIHEEPRHFAAGTYTCPVTHVEVELEADVPRPWVHWPIRIACSSCGETHLLNYEDVLQHEPAFGHE